MAALSGMESMFRAMGLGQVLDMAKAMAENGTFDKILKFADEAESLRLKVEELIDEVKHMRRENDTLLGNIPEIAEGTANFRSVTFAGSGSADLNRLAEHDAERLGASRAAE
jgi:hypothetical protein